MLSSALRALAPAAAIIALVAAMTAAAAPDRKPPRIVAAAMIDANRNSRADRVRLTYSEPVRHARQAAGRFPFSVAGYRINSAERASARTLVVVLGERQVADPTSAPVIRYARTRTKPVVDRAGNQALAQTFRTTRPHRNAPPPPTGPQDRDSDGTPDAEDCAPDDRAIHPKADDRPDLRFVDSNCDGIDGTEAHAFFASPLGRDTNPGTKAAPKRQIAAAVAAAAAAGKGRYILVAAGTYSRVEAATGVGVYGGYLADRWAVRNANVVTQIVGSPEGLLASGATAVELQLLAIRGEAPAAAPGASAYGIRAIAGAQLRLVNVSVVGADARPGGAALAGAPGRPGGDGKQGARGACDNSGKAPGGAGGTSPVGRDGGKGGDGRYESRGQDGEKGVVGTPGGTGGKAGIAGTHGTRGSDGRAGAPGPRSPGATSSVARATTAWRGYDGVDGSYGEPGMGGGGGGAGGGQDDLTSINGTGNAGAGGGGGGEGGRGGRGGPVHDYCRNEIGNGAGGGAGGTRPGQRRQGRRRRPERRHLQARRRDRDRLGRECRGRRARPGRRGGCRRLASRPQRAGHCAADLPLGDPPHPFAQRVDRTPARSGVVRSGRKTRCTVLTSRRSPTRTATTSG